MKELIVPVSGLMPFILAQTNPNEISGILSLAEKFGTWIIWFAIALYLFKRSEKKEEDAEKKRDAADAARQSVQERMLKAIEEQGKTNIDQKSILIEQSQQLHQMAEALKTNPCVRYTEDPIFPKLGHKDHQQ